MKFEYYEVRPVIETKSSGCISYTDEDNYRGALRLIAETGVSFETYWSLYGIYQGDEVILRDNSTARDLLSECIGDFASKEAAHEVMDAILAPLMDVRDHLGEVNTADMDDQDEAFEVRAALTICEDTLAQSSNDERI